MRDFLCRSFCGAGLQRAEVRAEVRQASAHRNKAGSLQPLLLQLLWSRKTQKLKILDENSVISSIYAWYFAGTMLVWLCFGM